MHARRVTCTLAVVAFGLMACGDGPPPHTPSTPSDDAWLDSLDGRYQAFTGPLELAGWQAAVGEPVADSAPAEVLQKEFYRDAELHLRLTQLATTTGPTATRARDWLRFLDRDRLTDDDEVRRLTAELVALADTPFGAPPAPLLLTLFYGSDIAARGPALAEVTRRSKLAMPLLRARAARMDVISRALNGGDSVSFLAGPTASDRLEATCRAQRVATKADWAALLAHATTAMGRPPRFADLAGEAIAWTSKAGAFYRPDALPALATRAVARMGFDVSAMNLTIRTDIKAPGGAAFGISIPDDVRFFLNAPPGFEGARGYFHELGHAIHMKLVKPRHLPGRQLPQDRALNEGIGEIFATIPRLDEFVRAEFPHLTAAERAEFHASVRAFDAFAVRVNCLTAQLELEAHTGGDVAARWPALYAANIGGAPEVGATFLLFVSGYLERPLYTLSYVYTNAVRDRFLTSLRDRSLLSVEAGSALRTHLLEPGNTLTLAGFLGEAAR